MADADGVAAVVAAVGAQVGDASEVDVGALDVADLLVQHVPHQRVREPPRDLVGVDEAGPQRPIEGRRRRPDVDAADRGQVVDGELVAQRGAAAEDAPAAVVELVHPVDDGIDRVDLAEELAEDALVVGTDRRRDAPLVQEPEGGPGAQRVAAAEAIDETEEGGAGLFHAQGADEPHLIGRRQGRGGDERGAVRAVHVVEEAARVRQRVERPVGHGDQQREVTGARQQVVEEVAEEGDGGAVDPVEVVDGEEGRLVGQRVEQAPGQAGEGGALLGQHLLHGHGGRATDGGYLLEDGGGAFLGAQHRQEGEQLLVGPRRRPAAPGGRVAPVLEVAARFEDLGLADAGLAVDDHDLESVALDRLDRACQSLQLHAATEEPQARWSVAQPPHEGSFVAVAKRPLPGRSTVAPGAARRRQPR